MSANMGSRTGIETHAIKRMMGTGRALEITLAWCSFFPGFYCKSGLAVTCERVFSLRR